MSEVTTVGMTYVLEALTLESLPTFEDDIMTFDPKSMQIEGILVSDLLQEYYRAQRRSGVIN